MKNIFIKLTLSLLFYSCMNSNKMKVEEKNPSTLAGTWELVSYVPGNDSIWTEYDDNIIYRKVITNTHFTWINYNKETNALLGTGGGTYKYDGTLYTEDIEFFYPPGSSILGQAIPFSVVTDNKQWLMTGYAKETEFDLETAEIVVVDSTKIEERWQKVD